VGKEAYRSTAPAAPAAPTAAAAPTSTATAAASAERLGVRHRCGAPAPTAADAPTSEDTAAAAAAAACADDKPAGQLLLHTPLLELDGHGLPVKPHAVVALDRSQRVTLTSLTPPQTGPFPTQPSVCSGKTKVSVCAASVANARVAQLVSNDEASRLSTHFGGNSGRPLARRTVKAQPA